MDNRSAADASAKGVEVHVILEGDEERLTGEQRDRVSAVLRECLRGAFTPAQATSVTVTLRIRSEPAGPPEAPEAPPAAGRDELRLSVREREVLECVARAMSNRQIGRTLSIAEGTVKRHLKNIFTKLGASSRLEAVNKAHESALIRR